MADPTALRRRATWAALSSVIDEDSLIEALWLQHDSMRGVSVTDIIGFVDAVANRHLLDAATRKRLYSAFFDALRQPDDTLPIDPWPLMLAARTPPTPPPMPRPAAYVMPPAPAAWAPPAFPPAPVAAPLPPAPAPVQPPAETPPPPPDEPPAPPHQIVFSALVGALIDGVRQYHAGELAGVLADCRARLDRARIPPALRAAARDALMATGTAHAWKLDGNADQLVAMVHEVYLSLCEALGPVDADHLLTSAVRQAERLPEARACPPNRFL